MCLLECHYSNQKTSFQDKNKPFTQYLTCYQFFGNFIECVWILFRHTSKLIPDPCPLNQSILFAFTLHQLSLICATHIFLDVLSSTGAWSTSQQQHYSRKLAVLFLVAINCQELLGQGQDFMFPSHVYAIIFVWLSL